MVKTQIFGQEGLNLSWKKTWCENINLCDDQHLPKFRWKN